MRIEGRTRRPGGPWEKITCHVVFKDPEDHKQTVSDSFQYYLGLDIELMKAKHIDHFSSPHNVLQGHIDLQLLPQPPSILPGRPLG